MDQSLALNYGLLYDLFRYNASLGFYRFIKGIDYGRVMELPVFVEELLRSSEQELNYLDIGSGESILPAFVASRTKYRVTVIDKFHWVRKQKMYLERFGRQDWLTNGRFNILEQDFLKADLPDASFDVITAVSVLEHIEGNGDTEAILKISRLLKPGGWFLMSSPYNYHQPGDYYLKGSVYGEKSQDGSVFFQRRYSAETLKEHILGKAPLVVEKLFYAGHYQRFNFAKYFYILPMPYKLVKVFYNWAAPFYVPRFMQLSSEPPSDLNPGMTTADTVFVLFRKPG